MTLVRLETATPRSLVEHSTNEPPRSQIERIHTTDMALNNVSKRFRIMWLLLRKCVSSYARVCVYVVFPYCGSYGDVPLYKNVKIAHLLG